MREPVSKSRLIQFLSELALGSSTEPSRVYLIGGATAVLLGWRPSTLDVDLCAERDQVLQQISELKKRLQINVELGRPEDSVPPLEGSSERHLFIETIGPVSYFHYDPYAQAFSKIVRGFNTDVVDATQFVRAKLVLPRELQRLVKAIPASGYLPYPRLSRLAVERAVDQFTASFPPSA